MIKINIDWLFGWFIMILLAIRIYTKDNPL